MVKVAPCIRSLILIVFLLAIAQLPNAAAFSLGHHADNFQQGSTPVRNCLYVPGLSTPATMPEEVIVSVSPTPLPTPTLPSTASVDAATTARQLEVFDGLWNAVNDHYVYADFRGRDWAAIGATYQAIVEGGLSDEAFYRLMGAMLNELGDEHSYFQSPTEVAQEAEMLARGNDFVGIGALFSPIPPGDTATILSVFPNSPAAEAGLLPHDVLLAVDGGPIRDEAGISRTRGPEGSIVTLTIQRSGTVPHEITVTRRRVTGSLPIDFCLILDTRIGYIFLPTFFDESIADQTRAALIAMTADGPLDGLILDNRMNGGGLGSVASAILGLFTSGVQGYFVSRESRDPLDIVGEDIGGSQTVPLIVLVDRDTVSYGEIVSGVLRLAGRAEIVGGPTLGNVEQLRRYDLVDGSRVWLASATFEPIGQAAGIWEDTGIVPDLLIPTRWDLFTEATDPALALAVERLMAP